MARRIAEKIRRKPHLMEIPRRVLARWKRKSPVWPACFCEWERILASNTTERVLEILTQDNDEGQRLRQSDPFIGILTEEERIWFLEHYEEDGDKRTLWDQLNGRKESSAGKQRKRRKLPGRMRCWG
jgi:hypothetical protein